MYNGMVENLKSHEMKQHERLIRTQLSAVFNVASLTCNFGHCLVTLPMVTPTTSDGPANTTPVRGYARNFSKFLLLMSDEG